MQNVIGKWASNYNKDAQYAAPIYRKTTQRLPEDDTENYRNTTQQLPEDDTVITGKRHRESKDTLLQTQVISGSNRLNINNKQQQIVVETYLRDLN